MQSIARMAFKLSMLFMVSMLGTQPAFADDGSKGPRAGKYLIMSYGAAGRPPLQLGYFVLDHNSYKAYLPGDKLSGSGKWQFDPAKKEVIWKSGAYAGVWEGGFKSERGGKTHNIRMKRGTFGTNSID